LNELVARFHYPLTYLAIVLVCVVNLASPGRSGGLALGSQALIEVTLPLQRMVAFPFREVSRFYQDYKSLVFVREENQRLRAQLAHVKDENLQYREAIVASERFQRLSGFRAGGEVPMVPANVVAQDLSSWFRSVLIDQGSTTGIRPGMPVITDSGVVGLVVGTTPRAAKILLVTDPQSRIDVYVQRTRAQGTLHGSASDLCDFEYVLRDQEVEAGDVLLTSGLGAVYPKGLVIGRVASVVRRPHGLFQVAQVEPAVDFRQLEEVFVLLEQRELPDDEDFSNVEQSLWLGLEAGE
jgi:rod shape-determining protein MreC